MNKPPAKKDSNADFGAVARQSGGANEVEAEQVAENRQISYQPTITNDFIEEYDMNIRQKPLAKNALSKCKAIASLKSSKTKKTIRVKTGAVGRPTGYREEYAEYAYRLCLLGFIDTQLAVFFEISIPTLYLWRKKHPEFSKSTKLGKITADAEVADGLYRRAIGMTIPDAHVSVYDGKVTLTPFLKHLPPDVTAARFWLKNRQPKLWKENILDTEESAGLFSIVIHECLRPGSEQTQCTAAERG